MLQAQAKTEEVVQPTLRADTGCAQLYSSTAGRGNQQVLAGTQVPANMIPITHRPEQAAGQTPLGPKVYLLWSWFCLRPTQNLYTLLQQAPW